MLFLSALILASRAATIAAAPAVFPPGQLHVRHDEVLLYGNGRHQVMKRSDLAALEAARKNPPPMPAWMDTSIPTLYGDQYIPATDNETNTAPQKRGHHEKDTLYIINPESDEFLDWDIATTTTMCSNGGYYNNFGTYTTTSISNSVSVGGGFDLKIVKDVLGMSFNTDYTRTWGTSKSITTSLYVGKETCGVVVLNAWTTRSKGYVWSGVVGESEGDKAGSLSEYQADRHKSKNYDGFEWVDGIISVCSTPMINGTLQRVKRCIGEGWL